MATRIAPFSSPHLEAACRVLVDTERGLSGTQFERLLQGIEVSDMNHPGVIHDAAAVTSVFFRTGQAQSGQAPATAAQAMPGAPGMDNSLAAFDPLAAGPTSTAAQSTDPTAVQNRQDQKEVFLQTGSTQTRNSGDLQMPT